jgi:hypothetical protein
VAKEKELPAAEELEDTPALKIAMIGAVLLKTIRIGNCPNKF